MKRILPLFFTLLATFSFGQAPKLYINFVSHNEPGDNLQQADKFNAMQTKVLELAKIFDAKNATWNLETCDGFPTGALQNQSAQNNIFRTITTAPYNDNIEIDPRPKTSFDKINIADTYHMLDSLGCKPTNTLGGFLYYNKSGAPDWFKYETEVKGLIYTKQKWQANLMWGAGSNPPHSNDLNDFGIWKPDTTNNFYKHNDKRTVWYMGNGCQPLQALDSTENEQTIISYVKAFVDSIQQGKVAQDKFYVYSIIINQSHFGPTLFKKVGTVIDSINAIGNDKIVWNKLTDKFKAFQTWQNSTKQSYSQWNCGEKLSGIEEMISKNGYAFYPNPVKDKLLFEWSDTQNHSIEIIDLTGKVVVSKSMFNESQLDLNSIIPGVYTIAIDGIDFHKLVKE